MSMHLTLRAGFRAQVVVVVNLLQMVLQRGNAPSLDCNEEDMTTMR